LTTSQTPSDSSHRNIGTVAIAAYTVIRDTTSGADMSSSRRTALVAGLWFAGTFVFSIPPFLLYDPVLNDAGYILGAGADARTELGAFLEVLTAIANIATAVVLFPILRRVSEAVALGYVALRIVEGTVIVIGLITLLAVVTLRQDFAGAGGDSGALGMAGQTLVAFHEWTRILGPQFCAGFGNGILLGYLMYKSGLVPRWMAWLGLVGGPLAFAGGWPCCSGRSSRGVQGCPSSRSWRSSGRPR